MTTNETMDKMSIMRMAKNWQRKPLKPLAMLI